MKKYVKINFFYGIVMPSQKDNILQFNQHMKLDKTPYIINADLESLIKKIDGCTNNPEKSSTRKICKHILWGYTMWPVWAFDNIESKHTLYRGKDCMKRFCSSLREHAVDFEKKKILPLSKKELNLHQDATACYICRKRF